MIEPIRLSLGQADKRPNGHIRMEIRDPDEKPVGVLVDDPEAGDFRAVLYGTTISMRAFKKHELLILCGLWLAYEKDIGIP